MIDLIEKENKKNITPQSSWLEEYDLYETGDFQENYFTNFTIRISILSLIMSHYIGKRYNKNSNKLKPDK